MGILELSIRRILGKQVSKVILPLYERLLGTTNRQTIKSVSAFLMEWYQEGRGRSKADGALVKVLSGQREWRELDVQSQLLPLTLSELGARAYVMGAGGSY